MADLKGKAGIVTGGSSGIGFQIANVLAEAGATVYVISRTGRPKEGVGESASGVVHLKGDVGDVEAMKAMVAELAAKHNGCLDFLVNNAGVSESTPFTEYTEETFDKVMDLNVKGVFNATKAASECMIAKGHGVILSTSSMVSIYGQPSGFAYPASKFAVNGLTVSLARELGPKGIRVNAVAPGITLTDMMKAVPKEVIDPLINQIPLRRLGQPEDIANAFVFLASDEASYITGVILSADGMARS